MVPICQNVHKYRLRREHQYLPVADITTAFTGSCSPDGCDFFYHHIGSQIGLYVGVGIFPEKGRADPH